MSFLKNKTRWTIKRLLLVKENQISCLKKFSALTCMERCKHSGLLKSVLSYASQLLLLLLLSHFSRV